MQVHDPKKFGLHLGRLRSAAGLSIPFMVKAITRASEGSIDLHPKLWHMIEVGGGGTQIDDDLIDTLMDCLPGFSPATAPGVTGPSQGIKGEGQSGGTAGNLGQAMGETPAPGDIPSHPMDGPSPHPLDAPTPFFKK
jgi:hypothetical protein